MARATVTQATICRAVKAVRDAGLLVKGVEIDADGRLRVIAGNAAETDDAEMTPLERRRARRGED